MTTSDMSDPSTATARSLRLAAVAGGIGIVGAVIWAFYVLLGLSMGGMVLGRNGAFDAIVVVPALGLGTLLLGGALMAVRVLRRTRGTTRVAAGGLFLVEAVLAISLCGYGAWAGAYVARTRLARTAGGRPTRPAAAKRATVVAPVTPRAKAR
jgi:hypothetical protein